MQPKKHVSIPLNSGHRFNWKSGRIPANLDVSIPLNSGHRFNYDLFDDLNADGGLNPFEFRASIQLTLTCASLKLATLSQSLWIQGIDSILTTLNRPWSWAVSIPLNSGHRFNLNRLWSCPGSRRLNPFEFRASIQSLRWLIMLRQPVSIPLNSGHRFN